MSGVGIGIYGTLHIAKDGLYVQQSAVGVTANNLANVNTPGYSRQSPVIETINPQEIGGIFFGRGSSLGTITKSYDKYLNNSIMLEANTLGQWEIKGSYLNQAETIFNESGELGLNSMLTDFWNSWQNLADHPEGIAERTVLQQSGQALASTFQRMSSNLDQIQTDANNNIISVLAAANQLSKEIADLNGQIAVTMSQRGNPNDLTDKRSLKIEELSKLIDVRALEQANGQITVLTSFGRPLASENLSWELSATVDPERNNMYAIIYNDATNKYDITDKIAGGNLKGLVETRDTLVPAYIEKLNALASSFSAEVNRIHYQGYGLDGSTGNYFFKPQNVLLENGSTNKGGGKIYAGLITDTANLKSSTFETKFINAPSAAPRYEIFDTVNEEYVYRIDAGNSTIVLNEGVVDTTIALTKGTYTGTELAGEIEKQLKANATTTHDYSVTYNTDQRKFTITNKGTGTTDIKWENANTTAAEILGFTKENKLPIASNGSVSSDMLGGTYTYASQNIQIVSGKNDQIVFNDDGTDRTAILTAGIYTADELAQEIEERLNEASIAPLQTYSVIFDQEDQKYTITRDSGPANINLRWTISSSAAILGFDNKFDSGGVVTDISNTGRYMERTFDIIAGSNTIIYDDGGIGDKTVSGFPTRVTATLTAGKYTGEELAAELEKQLESTYGSSGQDYIVTFDTRAGNFTITNAAGNTPLNIYWSTSAAAATLGFNPVNFTIAPNAIDQSDTTAGDVVTYDTIDFYGMSVRLTDDATTPQFGDTFSISTITDAAKTISMDSVTLGDAKKIAAAKDTFTIDGSNNTILFDDDGILDTTMSQIVIPTGEYTSDELAAEIEKQLEAESEKASPGAGQTYAVTYDSTDKKFTIASNPGNAHELFIAWENPLSTAGATLGFNNKIFEITAGTNDDIVFDEGATTFTATLTSGLYTGEEMAGEIQKQLMAEGDGDYTVAYDSATRKFTITNNAENTTSLSLNWTAPSSAAITLGFNPAGTPTITPGNTDISYVSPGGIADGFPTTSNFAIGGASVGDNRNALDLANLNDLAVLDQGMLTIGSYYSILVSQVGTDVDETSTMVSHEQFMIAQFEQRRQSIAGVSIDEEMVNLIKFQQAYAASAKMITTLDQMLDQLLNMR